MTALPIQKRIPGFGQKLMNDDYFVAVNSIIAVLRPHSTLRTIAGALAQQGFTTPSGLPFTRERLASYLKMNKLN
jgi:hypothetical protein